MRALALNTIKGMTTAIRAFLLGSLHNQMIHKINHMNNKGSHISEKIIVISKISQIMLKIIPVLPILFSGSF